MKLRKTSRDGLRWMMTDLLTACRHHDGAVRLVRDGDAAAVAAADALGQTAAMPPMRQRSRLPHEQAHQPGSRYPPP